MEKNLLCDVVIVGSGPAGLFSALKLKNSKLKTVLVDQNSVAGGMAFETDVNLQSINGFPADSDFGKRVLTSQRLANVKAQEAYSTLNNFGLPYKKSHLSSNHIDLKEEDFYSYPVGERILKNVLGNILDYLKKGDSLQILLKSRVVQIEKEKKLWVVKVKNGKKLKTIITKNVILATGKLSAKWILDTCRELGINHTHNNKIAIGIRLEGRATSINPTSRGKENRKIKIERNGYITETFCWCKNGGVIAYNFEGCKLLDGTHLYETPSMNTSFGIMTTIEVPEGVSNTEFCVKFSGYINSLGGGNIIMQRLGDFKKNTTSNKKGVTNNFVKPSLLHAKLANIRLYYPKDASDGILALIEKINKEYSNAVTDDCLLYAPIVERIFPIINLNKNMETSKKGIYMAGDCAGKSIGVTPSFVMGMISAESIIRNSQN